MTQVLYAKDNVAIIEGLNNDADVGTCLAFASGARGWAGVDEPTEFLLHVQHHGLHPFSS